MKRILMVALTITGYWAAAQTPDSLRYTETELSVETEGVRLVGTLTKPAQVANSIPVVLIIPGSGATDRDGNNKAAGVYSDAYKKMAVALALNNIATLRYDKRGVGQSKPQDPGTASKIFETDVKDAQAMANQLLDKNTFSQLIIAGHSQGALTGMLAAGNANKFIALAPVGLRGSETIKNQLAAQPTMVTEAAYPIIDSLVAGYLVSNVPAFLEPLFKKTLQPYMMSWFKYDPAQELAGLRIPSLVIAGDNDLQIPVTDVQAMIARSPGTELLIIPGMNHMFKIVSPQREENLRAYADPALPLADNLVNKMVEFIRK